MLCGKCGLQIADKGTVLCTGCGTLIHQQSDRKNTEDLFLAIKNNEPDIYCGPYEFMKIRINNS